MAGGTFIFGSIFGAKKARLLFFLFLLWLALNLTLLRWMLYWKFMGIDNFLSWAYAIILLLLAIDVKTDSL